MHDVEATRGSDIDPERAHKVRVIGYGFIKLLGMFVYAMLIHWTAQAKVVLGFLLVIFLLLGFILAPVHGAMLIYAGFNDDATIMTYSVFMCLFIGAFDVFIGLFGFCVFMTSLLFTLHLLLMVLYLLLALNILRVLYYDYFLFYAYKKILEGEPTTMGEERKLMCDRIRKVSYTTDARAGYDEEEEEEEE